MTNHERESRRYRLLTTLFWAAVAGFLMGGGVLLIAAVLR